MIYGVVLLCFIVFFSSRAEEQFQSVPAHVSVDNYCDFAVPLKNYDATDLLQCVDNLVTIAPETDKSTNGQYYGKEPSWFPLGDTISNLFNDGAPSYGGFPFLPGTTSGHYQSNYPATSAGVFDPSSGIGQNLFDALSSISRHDDYKCIPRILCEVASGNLPGRSLGEQSLDFLKYLGKNPFVLFFGDDDVAQTSPVLNFARAAVIGYANRGNSASCYRAFPKCPRDPQRLIHYLNNHNGGFFRFFRGITGANYRQVQSSYDAARGYNNLKAKEYVKVIPGISKETDRTGTGKIVYKYVSPKPVNQRKSIFPSAERKTDRNKVAFPQFTRITKFMEKYIPNVNNKKQPRFFPQNANHDKVQRYPTRPPINYRLPTEK